MLARSLPWLVATALCLPACKEEEDPGPTTTGPSDPTGTTGPMDPPSSWLVGEDGEMLRLSADLDVSTYPLDRATDFAAIECNGASTAWVVGDGATLLVTRDAGESWDPIVLGVPATTRLRSIAVTEGALEGSETLWVVGDGGVVLRSSDGGQAFDPVQSPAVDWTSVTTDERGTVGFAAGLDGSVWRSEAGAPLVLVHAADGEALYDVSMSDEGTTVVAVGEAGRMLRSDDAGDHFTALASETTLDLHAVHLAADAMILAVGEAGVVVRMDSAGTSVQQTLAADDALYDLHLRADGFGEAVGTRGAVLLTHDAGLHWDAVDTGRTADLHGVDDFHPEAHL